MAIRVRVPDTCHLRTTANLTDHMLLRDLEVVRSFEDDTHLIRSLRRCTRCGQLYFYEFYEEVDWAEGNDPQYRTWVPVEDEASAAELCGLSPFQILQYPSIRCDFPSSAKAPLAPRWVITKE